MPTDYHVTRLYIGSNNETGRLEMSRLLEVLENRFAGYTIQAGTGFWMGDREDCVIVTIATVSPIHDDIIEQTAIAMTQKAIMVESGGTARFVNAVPTLKP